MQKIIIDQEFKDLLPPLDKETYTLLEDNILTYGCRDSLVLWQNILIDGHNRYAICAAHNIPYTTVTKDFDSREAVMIWIISTQVARRNLTPLQLSHYRGLHYKADKKIQGTSNQYVQESEKGHNDLFHSTTATRIAEQYHVSAKTIQRDAKVAQAIEAIGDISHEAKLKILSGEVDLDKQGLRELSSKTSDELGGIAKAIEQGTYEKAKPQKSEPEAAKPPRSTNEKDVATSAASHLDTHQLDAQQLDAALTREEGDFKLAWQQRMADKEKAGLKPLLRSHIDKLEKLYASM